MWRTTFHICAANTEGVGLFDPFTMKCSNFWRFSEDDVSISSTGDADEFVIWTRGKGSTMHRIMGMTEVGNRWVMYCADRAKLLSDLLFLRDCSQDEMKDPHVYMGYYGLPGKGMPQRHVQIFVGAFGLQISQPDGEVVAEVTYWGIQRIRRLGDVPGGIAIRHQFQWAYLISDEREELLNALKTAEGRLGITCDLGCSIAMIEIDTENSALDRTRVDALEQWPVTKQPAPKSSVSKAAWRKVKLAPSCWLVDVCQPYSSFLTRLSHSFLTRWRRCRASSY